MYHPHCGEKLPLAGPPVAPTPLLVDDALESFDDAAVVVEFDG